jgi:lysophospholipase L1-like esterase
MKRVFLSILAASIATSQAPAQATGAVETVTGAPRVGILDHPCAALEQPPALVASYMANAATARAAHRPAPPPSPEALAAYAAWQSKLLASDFSGLCHYDAANARLAAATPHRVIFFGDSITELWGMNAPDLFRDDNIDRGVSGQTTEQMLGRFRADVIDLHPATVHIMAGSNDIAGNTGPTTLAWIEANIQTMVDLAEAHHIIVILAAILPAARFSWRPELKPADTIIAYNRWLKDFAARKGLPFVDYHAVLDDGHGGIRAGLSDDGVHPNTAGYAILTPVARAAIQAAATGRHS